MCAPGFTGDFCDSPDGTPVSPGGSTQCTPNPCQNGATCSLITGGGIVCNCATGYSGPRCELPGSLS